MSGESVFESLGDSDTAGLGGVAGPNLPPKIEAELSDEFFRLLDALGDDDLRRIALWKMDGSTDVEIAARRGKAVPTVERRRVIIRKK